MMDYTNLLNKETVGLKPSGIRKFFDMLNDMKDAIALTVGQPDFVTPWHIREAAIKSLEEGRTYYTPNSGLSALREELSRYAERRFNLKYDPKSEIIVTIGGSEAIDLAIRTIVAPGDEVIIPEPCFVCYDPIVRLAGGVPVPISLKAENDFKLTPGELEDAVTEKTKLVVLAFPNNPTGATLDKDELEALAKIIRGTDIFVLSDEIYAELTYGVPHTSIATLEGMKERTVVVNGFSKAYAMTGWRLGFTLAPKEISEHMYKVHQFCIMCAPTTSQFAAIQALKNGDEDIEYMKAEYNRRRTYIVEGLRNIGIECFEPKGAFYVWPNIGNFGLTSEVFCERLLYEEGVAIVPGTAFGACGEGFARISYAYSIKHIGQALERMEKFVNKLKAEQNQ